MKKLLILMLVLGLASVSQAVIVELTVDNSQVYVGTPGVEDEITIELKADLDCTAFMLGAVGETLSVDASGQTTSVTNMGGWIAGTIGSETAITAPTGSLTSAGYVNNYEGLLFDAASWYGNVLGGSPYGGVIATFVYTIPASWDGTEYWVAPLVSGTTYYYMEGASATAESSYGTLLVGGAENIDIGGVHIIPEPATMALLGLGSLFLLRRRK